MAQWRAKVGFLIDPADEAENCRSRVVSRLESDPGVVLTGQSRVEDGMFAVFVVAEAPSRQAAEIAVTDAAGRALEPPPPASVGESAGAYAPPARAVSARYQVVIEED